MADKPVIVGFVGYSGSGKTQLATAVTEVLTARGFRVAALKNAHHRVDIDKPGKDSWRYRQSGATQVMLRTGERWAMMVEEPAPDVDQLLKKFDKTDIILVEGFKNEGSFPKIEVIRAATRDKGPALYPLNPDIVALATDMTDLTRAPAVLDINDPAAVADFIVCLK